MYKIYNFLSYILSFDVIVKSSHKLSEAKKCLLWLDQPISTLITSGYRILATANNDFIATISPLQIESKCNDPNQSKCNDPNFTMLINGPL